MKNLVLIRILLFVGVRLVEVMLRLRLVRVRFMDIGVVLLVGVRLVWAMRFVDDQVLVTGGYNYKPTPCQNRTLNQDEEKLVFLRVEAREPWLLLGASGLKYVSEGLTGRTTLVKELRKHLEKACDGEPTDNAEIRCHGEAAGSVDDDDPMAQVAEDEVVDMQKVKTSHAYRRSRYFKNNVKGKIIAVSMPQRARETGIDEGDRMVRLYCESMQKIWLSSKDADWALVYLRDQLTSKGVRRVAPGDRGPGVRPEEPGPAGPPCLLALTDGVHPE